MRDFEEVAQGHDDKQHYVLGLKAMLHVRLNIKSIPPHTALDRCQQQVGLGVLGSTCSRGHS